MRKTPLPDRMVVTTYHKAPVGFDRLGSSDHTVNGDAASWFDAPKR
jgi:hypothetical protein